MNKLNILQFGNPGLLEVCHPVENNQPQPGLENEIEQLFATLSEFKRQHGWGRAIAAPQVGINKRMIGLNLGEGPFIMINPVITNKSEDTKVIWDDCMSMPSLLVEVERHISIDVQYYDEQFQLHELTKCSLDLSELLQHEIDHLDGIVMTERMINQSAIIDRSEKSAFEQWRKPHNSSQSQ